MYLAAAGIAGFGNLTQFCVKFTFTIDGGDHRIRIRETTLDRDSQDLRIVVIDCGGRILEDGSIIYKTNRCIVSLDAWIGD